MLDADQKLGEPLPDGSGGFILPFENGTARLRYGAATAIDAAGRRRGVAVAIVEGRITLTVDGGWLATAAYPVIVDPLIGVETNGHYQGRPAAASWNSSREGRRLSVCRRGRGSIAKNCRRAASPD